jgi:hypothetical protein
VKSQHSNAFRWYVAKFGVTGFTSRQNIDALIKRPLEDDTCRKWRKISSAFKRGNAAVDDPPCRAFDWVDHVEQSAAARYSSRAAVRAWIRAHASGSRVIWKELERILYDHTVQAQGSLRVPTDVGRPIAMSVGLQDGHTRKRPRCARSSRSRSK